MNKEKISIEKLGEEYEKHIELQNFFIDKCKADINKAKISGDTDAVIKLQSDLRKFYKIKNELTETASHLKSYYKNKGDS